jgi:hypothetical protein
MRAPLLVLAALMILGGNVLIAAVAGSIPHTMFAGRSLWGVPAGALIALGVCLVLWVNLRHAN